MNYKYFQMVVVTSCAPFKYFNPYVQSASLILHMVHSYSFKEELFIDSSISKCFILLQK